MPYQRVVCFKFKLSATEEQIQHHMDTFAALKAAVPHIASYRSGRTVPEGGVPPQWDSLHYATFEHQDDIQLYHDHPAHQQFIHENRAIWDKVFVLNAAID